MSLRTTDRTNLRVRAVISMARLLSRMQRSLGILAEETALAWLRPSDHDALAASIYAARTEYAPGGSVYDRGLFDWERSAIADPAFPRTGTVLVAAAGAGREMLPLARLGYSVVGFDACAELVETGSAALRSAGTDALLFQARFEDLVAAASGADSRLETVLAGREFAAVVIGWTSFSCLTSHAARVGLLGAIRRIAPSAPVLISYLRGGGKPPDSRLRRVIRRFHAAVGAPGRPRDGLVFLSHAGIMELLQPEEVAGVATLAGYRVVRSDEITAHALLVPGKAYSNE